MSDAKRKELEAEIKKVQNDTELDNEQKARKIELLKTEADLEAKNEALSGVGLRWFAGLTRGKGSQVIKWQAFDESDTESYPKTLEDFTAVVKPTKDDMLKYAIEGFNSAAYAAASDPIAEYVNPAWPSELAAQFKIAVRNYHRALMGTVTLEAAATQMKSGVEAAYQASLSK